MSSTTSQRSVAIIGSRGYPSYYGGFETLVRHLAPYLAESGWDVTVYGRRDSTADDDPLKNPRVRTVVTAGMEKKSTSTLSYGFTAVTHAARRKPDVALVLNVANGFWLPILGARRIPTVVNVDGIEWERDKWGRAAKAVFKGGARMTARHADHLVVDSREIGRRWRTGYGRTGEYIPYGGNAPGALDPVNGFAPGTYALYVARFVPENSVAEFLDAAEQIAQTRDVVIVGSSGYGGEFDDRAVELAETNDRIHWLGHLRDDNTLHSLWQHAGAYFHGHSVGGTNPALVQAVACGAPIVARDTPYNREVLGDEYRFVAPDADEIATAILATIGADKSTKASLKVPSWEEICEQYESTLINAINQARK